MLAAGAGGLLGADASVGFAAAGCWLDHVCGDVVVAGYLWLLWFFVIVWDRRVTLKIMRTSWK